MIDGGRAAGGGCRIRDIPESLGSRAASCTHPLVRAGCARVLAPSGFRAGIQLGQAGLRAAGGALWRRPGVEPTAKVQCVSANPTFDPVTSPAHEQRAFEITS